MPSKKSSHHSKMAGDLGEALVLYWLSKHGYECVRADHTGIDIIARKPGSSEPWGIAVQTRTRGQKDRRDSVRFGEGRAKKAETACKSFRCLPYVAFVVDAPRGKPVPRGEKANKTAFPDDACVRVYLTSMKKLKKMNMIKGWLMSDKRVLQYEKDRSNLITRLILDVTQETGW